MINGCEKTRNITIFGMNDKEKTALLFNPRCKTWGCDYCAEINKQEWIDRASRGVMVLQASGATIQFVTLTSRPYAGPSTGLYFLKENWPKLNRRIKYHTEKGEENLANWNYLIVPERHKTGVVHCHILAATDIHREKDWKFHAHKSGFGWKVDVDPVISAKDAAGYVSKYLHKGVGKEVWPDNFRRVRCSRGWPNAHQREDGAWRWLQYLNQNIIWQEKNALLDMGWTVLDKRENAE